MSSCDPDKFVDREKELVFVEERVSRLAKGVPFAPHERVIHFVGPSGIGKSCLLDKFYGNFDKDPKCLPVLIKLNALGSGHDGFVDNFLVAIYEAFCRYQKISIEKQDGRTRKQFAAHINRRINDQSKNQVVIFFLDEINVPHREELQQVEESLLENLLHNNGHLVLIMAGRLPSLWWGDFALRPNPSNTLVLPPFDAKITKEQIELEKEMQVSDHLIEKTQKLGGGIPGKNKKLVAHMVGNPPDILDEFQAIQSLLADVRSEIEERFYPIVEAICVLPFFMPDDVAPLLECHPMLDGVWHERKIKEVFTDLNKVQIGPGGLIHWDKRSWVMDGPTRQLFERELRMRDPELWRKLQCTAYQMYKNWGEEFQSQDYKDKAAYHQQCLQSAGLDCDDTRNEG